MNMVTSPILPKTAKTVAKCSHTHIRNANSRKRPKVLLIFEYRAIVSDKLISAHIKTHASSYYQLEQQKNRKISTPGRGFVEI